MDLPWLPASIKRKYHLRPLQSLVSVVKINEQPEYIDPSILFTRLTAVALREENVEQYFRYEMSPYPPSLFKDALMRKANKPALRKALMSEEEAISNERIPTGSSYVIDGGALVHRVRWLNEATFQEIAKMYVSYVRRHYGTASIVFDGYEDLSTKSNEHLRRIKSKCEDIIVNEINTLATTHQERFLSNEYNKRQLITLISQHLLSDGQQVKNCSGDADTSIVETAITLATNAEDTVVVIADDTDVAVMLMYHWKDSIQDIIFYSERLQKGWSIKSTQLSIVALKEHLLFIHTWSGCDTVSAPFGKGKVSFLILWRDVMKLRKFQFS